VTHLEVGDAPVSTRNIYIYDHMSMSKIVAIVIPYKIINLLWKLLTCLSTSSFILCTTRLIFMKLELE